MSTIKRNTLAAVGIILGAMALVWQVATQPAIAAEQYKDALIVDVRTAPEFEAKHHPKAINLPLQELDRRLDELEPQDREIVVYCRSGRRSGLAKGILDMAGFTNVTNGGSLAQMGL